MDSERLLVVVRLLIFENQDWFLGVINDPSSHALGNFNGEQVFSFQFRHFVVAECDKGSIRLFANQGFADCLEPIRIVFHVVGISCFLKHTHRYVMARNQNENFQDHTGSTTHTTSIMSRRQGRKHVAFHKTHAVLATTLCLFGVVCVYVLFHCVLYWPHSFPARLESRHCLLPNRHILHQCPGYNTYSHPPFLELL